MLRCVPLLALCLLASPFASAAEWPEPAKLPVVDKLPDPLLMFDGKTRVRTAEEWTEKRRPELKDLIQHYMYGQLPKPAKFEAKVLREDKKALGGKATLREVHLKLADEREAPPVHLLLVVPNERKGPAPV